MLPDRCGPDLADAAPPQAGPLGILMLRSA